MGKISTKLSKAAWVSIWRRTAIVMGLSMAGSLLATEFIMSWFSDGINLAGAACAIVLPLILGGPMVVYLQIKNQQLAALNVRLQVLASTDSLTSCLNRRAFTTQVNALLAAATDLAPAGALLVIDADEFKSVNDRFGHDVGDRALEMIAEAIRGSVREGDLVGRLGGEEFGAFLVGANQDAAAQVAERMLESIRHIDFAPDGQHCLLSVSIGGAAFTTPQSFARLYRAADQRLYDAKKSGRDRCEFLPMAA